MRPRHGDCPFAAIPQRLTFTADVEPNPTDPGGRRHLAATATLLDLLDETGARGTFFILGEVADDAPWLVRDIAARGHEVASHGQTHRSIEALGPAGLLAEATRARATLQDHSGQDVPGFRAPFFSLTAKTGWAAGIIAAAGHTYSSSVLPARGFGHGHPAAPRQPFAWPLAGGRELLELPVPIARLGPLRLPFLGGMYLRYLPAWDLRGMAGRLEGPLAWTYCHPYDIDTSEPFRRKPGLGLVSSAFLWANRRVTLGRLRGLMRDRVSIPLAERLDEARALAGLPPLGLGADVPDQAVLPGLAPG